MTDDDLEGLNFLYPDCDELPASPRVYKRRPVCYETRSLSGWLRLLIAIGVPFILAACVLLLLSFWVRRYQQQRVLALKRTIQSLKARQQWVRAGNLVRAQVRQRRLRAKARTLRAGPDSLTA